MSQFDDFFALVKTAQCGKINFLPLTFYVKSFFDDFKVSKTAILTILDALNVDFGNFWKAEICQIQKSRASKTAKMADLDLLDSPKLISRKI